MGLFEFEYMHGHELLTCGYHVKLHTKRAIHHHAFHSHRCTPARHHMPLNIQSNAVQEFGAGKGLKLART